MICCPKSALVVHCRGVKQSSFRGYSPVNWPLEIYHHRHASELKAQSPLVMALGVYDGVHLGHKKVLNRLVYWKSEENLSPSVWTFRSPMPKPGFERIMGSEQLYRALEKEGVEVLHTLEFMEIVKEMTAEAFLTEILQKGLGVKVLVVGEDARLGKGRESGARELSEIGDKIGMMVDVVPVLEKGEEELSSTRIRESLRSGDLTTAEELMGHYYAVGGYVYKDQGRARKMGFPTANLSMEGRVTLPYGVYGARASTPDGPISEKKLALVYLGERPTVEGKIPVLEVHLPDWEGDLYGRYLEVSDFDFIREEKKFDSLDVLSEQIHADLLEVKKRCS